MKKKLSVLIPTVLMIAMLITTTVAAQYAGYVWITAYQVVNMGAAPADITISYYKADGTEVVAARKTYLDVAANASVLVQQFSDDPNLPGGQYSAVVSADQPVAAIVNQQLYPAGATSNNPTTPFSTYNGESSGALKVILPSVMYNWFNYYTEFFVMNVGSAAATNVNVTYNPSTLSGSPTGASGVTEPVATINQFASKTYSQQSKATLGAASGPWAGKFYGSAVITSDQPIIAVVNQHNPTSKLLMTYNGFASAATKIVIPTHMRGYFGYFTSLAISNPDPVNTAHVTILYTPKTGNIPNSTTPYSVVSSGTMGPVSVNYDILPNKSILRQDYPGALDEQSDLDDNPVFSRFYGSVLITSDIPVVSQTNVQATNNQAGAINGIPEANWSQNLVAPVILADFYGYSTTMLIRNTTNASITCNVTYTSDHSYSAQPDKSKTYAHTLGANDVLEIYEGHLGNRTDGDVNSDTFWRSGGLKQFIGSASISCTGAVVALVNEDKAGLAGDNMYAMNVFSK